MAIRQAGNILDTIVAAKQIEVAARRAATPLAELEARLPDLPPVRGFARALAAVAAERPAIIAEVKRGSPSLGCIRPHLDAARQARAYAQGGAAALSVLTDRQFFFGGDDDFCAARQAVDLPMLRKDFIVDAYQLYESRVLGADCVLLILSVLPDAEAREFAELAHELGMDVLAETHDEAEIRRATAHVPYDLIGINNRNLKTFHTSEQTTMRLADSLDSTDALVAESGLHSPAAIADCWRRGVRRFLVGEAFVRSPDPANTVRSFISMQEDRKSP